MEADRRTVAVLSLVVFLVMLGIAIIIPALPAYGRTFGASAFLVGLLVGALAAARVFLDLPSGVLGDRYGNRFMMQTGLGIIALSSAVAVLAFDYWVLLAVRVFEGVGSAFYVTSSLAALAKASPMESRGRAMSTYVGSLLLGLVFGPVLGGAVTVPWGIRAPFAAYAVVASVGMVLIAVLLRASPGTLRTRGTVDWAQTRALFRNRDFVLVNVGTMSAFFIRGGMIGAILPLFIQLNLGFRQEEAVAITGLLITVSALTSLVTMVPAGILADRVGRKIPFVLSLIGIGLLTPLIFFARTVVDQIVVMAVYGLVLGLHGPLAAWSADLAPEGSMGTAMGVYRTIGDMGFLLGPLVLTAVADLTATAAEPISLWPFLVGGAWLTASGFLLLIPRDPAGERRAARRGAVVPDPDGNGEG
jgi:MFS family permease